MKKSQARGYLLEIVLSKLIGVNGYELILSENRQDIIKRNNGLNVKGRGGFHQFDTLGKFKVTPPFIYPLRLFVEAKFYTDHKVGIDRVRMGIGILQDVNTNYSTVEMNEDELNVEKYNYNYAIFSTSGFTEDAQRLAIAHKIHLVDLSGDEYRFIINAIRLIINELASNFSNGGDNIPRNVFNEFKNVFSSFIFNGIDRYDHEYNNGGLNILVNQLGEEIENKVIYLSSVNSPHIIPLLSNNKFNEFLQRNPHQRVSITWNDENPYRWTLTTENMEHTIIFTLPKLLFRLLDIDDNIEQRAMCIKGDNLSKFVFIAYFDDENPTICTLKFDPQIMRNHIENNIRD